MKIRYYGFLALVAVSVLAAPSPADAGTVRLCTGAADGNYARAGGMIASFGGGGLDIQVVVDTGGTGGNIERVVKTPVEDPNACDAMIAQPDGVVHLKRENPAAAGKLIKVGELHREYLHVLCNKASKVGELEDLEGNSQYSVAIGGPGSGAWFVWQNFIAEDADYDAIQPKPLSGIEAASDVAQGGTTCMLIPAGLGHGSVNEAGDLFGDDLVLVQAQDKDFNDAVDLEGKPLYTFSEIPGDAYEAHFTAGWGGDVDTISWPAAVYINNDRVSKDDRAAFIRAVANGRKQAIAAFGG